MEKVLTVSGFGDVHEEHFERGLVLAENYFFEHGLDFLKCYDVFDKDEKSELGKHWSKAEQVANFPAVGSAFLHAGLQYPNGSRHRNISVVAMVSSRTVILPQYTGGDWHR